MDFTMKNLLLSFVLIAFSFSLFGQGVPQTFAARELTPSDFQKATFDAKYEVWKIFELNTDPLIDYLKRDSEQFHTFNLSVGDWNWVLNLKETPASPRANAS